VAKRIKRYYNRDAEVVYGPASVEKFLPIERKPEDFYLFFGQLTGYKRADIAIDACIASGRKLIVAGSGAGKKERSRYVKSALVIFRGRISDEELKSLLARAKALIFPGIEDLGLVPIEANAAGCPVIAYRDGGVLDTVKEGVTGIFFDEQTPESLIKALDRFEAMVEIFNNRDAFTQQVRQFSREAFKERVRRIIAERKRV
jgi:glycosyltransferase involved in cell wall biosynthesis